MRAAIFIGLGAIACAACDRTHLSSSYGQAVRRAFKCQVIDAGAGGRPARVQGLDPEEAAIVAKAYRESLSPRKEDQPRTQMLVVPAPQAGVPAPQASAPPR
jgi:hypothetical protein